MPIGMSRTDVVLAATPGSAAASDAGADEGQTNNAAFNAGADDERDSDAASDAGANEEPDLARVTEAWHALQATIGPVNDLVVESNSISNRVEITRTDESIPAFVRAYGVELVGLVADLARVNAELQAAREVMAGAVQEYMTAVAEYRGVRDEA